MNDLNGMEEEENTMLMQKRMRKERRKGYHDNDDAHDHCKQEMDANN
jgi:hypothetical protein